MCVDDEGRVLEWRGGEWRWTCVGRAIVRARVSSASATVVGLWDGEDESSRLAGSAQDDAPDFCLSAAREQTRLSRKPDD